MLRERLQEITDQQPPEEHARSIEALRVQANHRIVPMPSHCDPSRYTCVVHAFHLTERPGYLQVALSGNGSIFAGADFINFLLKNNRLEPREQHAVIGGDLVLYFDEGKFKHVGRLVEPSRVLSKWGTFGLYEHALLEVPSSYGKEIRFFVGPSEEIAYLLFLSYAESQGVDFGSTTA